MHILIAGPGGAKLFLEALAGAVRADGVRIERRYDLQRPSAFDEWAEVDILVPFALPCSDADMASAPRLRAIIVPSLGYEDVDVESAAKRQIVVANGRTPENFESVAEAAALFMLMILYDIRASARPNTVRVRRRQLALSSALPLGIDPRRGRGRPLPLGVRRGGTGPLQHAVLAGGGRQ
jgi:phosphoglycerate dehydrogenase-like enzyme